MTTKSLLMAAAAIAVLAMPLTAQAVVYTGQSTATLGFSNADPGNIRNNSAQQVEWGYENPTCIFFCFGGSPGSTMTAASPFNISGNSDVVGQQIAKLTWYNDASPGNVTPDRFTLNWNIIVTFTAPAGSSGDSESFNLPVFNTSNPTGDEVTLASLAGLAFNLAGINVSNFRYTEVGPGSIVGNKWLNPEHNTTDLYIVADFTTRRVPEPASLALLGAGLAGLGFARRRKTA